MSTETLPLTNENVETVLDELRPFLISDGGNVEIAEIDGPIVKVRLQGACGSCPSSTMTLKMGIERKLKEMIPEISEVVQVLWAIFKNLFYDSLLNSLVNDDLKSKQLIGRPWPIAIKRGARIPNVNTKFDWLTSFLLNVKVIK